MLRKGISLKLFRLEEILKENNYHSEAIKSVLIHCISSIKSAKNLMLFHYIYS